MNNRTMGVIYGVAILVFWFMPFRTINFFGLMAPQSGEEIGGIAYLLILGGIAIAVTSWMEQHQPSMIIAGVGIVISMLIANGFPEWGLSGIIMCFLFAGIRAFSDFKKAKKLSLASDTNTP